MKLYYIFSILILICSFTSLIYIEDKLKHAEKDMHYVVAYFFHVICSFLLWFIPNIESEEELMFSHYMMLYVIVMYTRLSFIVIFS